MHLLGFSSDEDNGYYPGDKVTISVSRYVPNGQVPYGTIDATGRASYIPQPVIDSKTVTLGETGAVMNLDMVLLAQPVLTLVCPRADTSI